MLRPRDVLPLIPPIALAFSIALAAEPGDALARAGGGSHFGGGHTGGSHSTYGGGYHNYGGGGFFSLWPLLFLGHGSGFFTLLIVIAVVYYFMRQNRQIAAFGPVVETDQTEPSAPAVAPVAYDAAATQAELAKITARDPGFDERSFLDRAQTAFFKVQQAWQARDQDVARDVLSDALYERHKMQTDELIAEHKVNILKDIVIGHARIVGATAGQPYDSIVVSFTASMTDYEIDENTKQVVFGSQYPTTFTESWTFIRRADAKTAVGQKGLASTCPSCGAPLKLTNGKCDYCGTPVRTSSSEWVVDQIEQVT